MIKICPNKNRAVAVALVATLVSLLVIQTTRANDIGEQAVRIVAQIQRADYEGDRTAMQRGYDDLKPFSEEKDIASRIRYWRGFAQWRRAINGFNDSVDPKELEHDLKTALDEFKIALEKDPTFVDAKVGTISCLGYLAFMNRKDQAHAKELVAELMMSLAYSYLNTTRSDVNAAERCARDALEIVPYWHYVRDILLPQILAAKAKVQ